MGEDYGLESLPEDFNMADNATEIVDDGAAAVDDEVNSQQTEISNENDGEYNTIDTEDATAAANGGVEDVTKTQAFSRRLKEYGDKRVNDVYAGFGWTNPYTGEPIKTEADYQNYRSMQEAFERGQDPKLVSEVNMLRQQLDEYKLRDMDSQLLNDAQEQEFYKTVREDCINLVNYAKTRGVNISLMDAYNTVKARNFNTYMANTQKKAEANVVQKINAVNQGAVGSLSTPETPKVKTVDEMSLTDISNIAERVLKGEKIKL